MLYLFIVILLGTIFDDLNIPLSDKPALMLICYVTRLQDYTYQSQLYA